VSDQRAGLVWLAFCWLFGNEKSQPPEALWRPTCPDVSVVPIYRDDKKVERPIIVYLLKSKRNNDKKPFTPLALKLFTFLPFHFMPKFDKTPHNRYTYTEVYI
jgi:hypothetical protein